MQGHINATFSNNLTVGENEFLKHMQRWGSDGYPVGKLGRKWQFSSAFGVGGTPVLYPTKKLASGAVEAYINILLDKVAGRLDPSPGSPATFHAAYRCKRRELLGLAKTERTTRIASAQHLTARLRCIQRAMVALRFESLTWLKA